MVKHKLPPVIILDGGANALSIARSLGRSGVKVFAISEPTSHVRYSRYCQWIPLPHDGNLEESWTRYLLGPESDALGGSVLLTGSDAGIEYIAHHRAALARRFRLDDSNQQAQLCMLNKLSTYQSAAEAGVPTPKFWRAETREQVMQIKESLVFPLIVKPLY